MPSYGIWHDGVRGANVAEFVGRNRIRGSARGFGDSGSVRGRNPSRVLWCVDEDGQMNCCVGKEQRSQ